MSLSNYPEAGENEQRVVIHLPSRGDEEDCQVELIPGTLTETQTFVPGGRIKSFTANGVTFYRVRLGGAPSKQSKFSRRTHPFHVREPVPGLMQPYIEANKNHLLPYDSETPLVIYLPKGGEMRYRVWSAEGELTVPSSP